MNYQIINNKKHIKKLRQERDELFSILDEVSYEQQTILLESIIDITNTIDKHKNNLEVLLKHENY